MGGIFWLLKFQIFFMGCLEFLIFLGDEREMLGASLHMKKKWEYPPPPGTQRPFVPNYFQIDPVVFETKIF